MSIIDKVFPKDTLVAGLLLGGLMPAVLYFGIWGLLEWQHMYMTANFHENMQLLLIAVNGITMRYFLITRDQEQIGKGILAITFVWLLYYVVTFHLYPEFG